MKLRYLDKAVSLNYYPDKCTGCEMCVKVCPRAVFKMHEKKAVLADKGACIECGACAINCRFNAITVETGPGCAAAILASGKNNGACCC